jgi:WD40 repeat protein
MIVVPYQRTNRRSPMKSKHAVLLLLSVLVILSVGCGTLDLSLVSPQASQETASTPAATAAPPATEMTPKPPTATVSGSTSVPQPTTGAAVTLHASPGAILDVKGLHVLWSPDGRQLYVGGEKLHVFDAVTLAEIRTRPADREVKGLAVSPDGSVYAVNDEKEGVVLYDAAGGELRTLAGTNNRTHTPSNSSMAFTPDSAALAVVVGDVVKFYAVASGEERITIPAAGAFTLAVSPDGRRLYAGGTGDAVTVWDIDTGTQTAVVGEDLLVMNGMALSPDGTTLATSDTFRGLILLWDTATGRKLRTLEGHAAGVIDMAFSPDGRILASTSQDVTLRLWDVAAGKSIQTLTGHTEAASSIAFSPDGSTLASGSTDGTTRLWTIAEGGTTEPLPQSTGIGPTPTPIPLSARAISPDNAASVKKLSAVDVADSQTAVFSPDGRWLILAGSRMHILDAGTYQETRTINLRMAGLAVSPDGRILAAVGHPGIILFDLPGGDERLTIPRTVADTSATSNGFLAFSPDSATLAAIVDNVVKLYDTADGAEKGTIVATMPYNIAFSPDGRYLYAGGWAANITAWDVFSGENVLDFGSGSNGVNRMALSPDGGLLATVGTFYGEITLWNTATGHPARTLTGHTDSVTSLAFSPDGRLLFSASRDVTLRIWDTASGKLLATLVGHTQAPDFLTVHPDGATLISHSANDGLFRWGLPAE